MDAGALTERISIYTPISGRNLTSLDDYELSGSVWANVRQITTRDQMRSGVDIQSGQMTVLIRYISNLSDDCLILWNGSYYAIDNLSPNRQKGEILMGVSYSGMNENQRLTT